MTRHAHADRIDDGSARLGNADGFSLLEVLVATGLMATGILALAHLFALSTRSNQSSRTATYTAVLAQQKIEQLRALTWGFDVDGRPVGDTSTDTGTSADNQGGGTGLSPSPASSLVENTPGYVDYLDMYGQPLGAGATAPAGAIYLRRWSIEPLPAFPDSSLIIRVWVSHILDQRAAGPGAGARQRDEAALMTVRTRKAP